MLFTLQLLALFYFIWILFGWFTSKYALVRNTLLVCVCLQGNLGLCSSLLLNWIVDI